MRRAASREVFCTTAHATPFFAVGPAARRASSTGIDHRIPVGGHMRGGIAPSPQSSQRRGASTSPPHGSAMLQQFTKFVAGIASHANRSHSQPTNSAHDRRAQDGHLKSKGNPRVSSPFRQTARGSSCQSSPRPSLKSQQTSPTDATGRPPPMTPPRRTQTKLIVIDCAPQTPPAITPVKRESWPSAPSTSLLFSPKGQSPIGAWHSSPTAATMKINQQCGLGHWQSHAALNSVSSTATLPPAKAEVLRRAGPQYANGLASAEEFCRNFDLATWTRTALVEASCNVEEIFWPRHHASHGSTMRSSSEPPHLSRAFALRRARQRLSSCRRIAALQTFKAEARVRAALDAWREILQEASRQRELRALEQQAHASEVAATRRVERWRRKWILQQSVSCWKSFIVSTALAHLNHNRQARWQKPSPADQAAEFLSRARMHLDLQQLLAAWSWLVRHQHLLREQDRCRQADELTAMTKKACLEQIFDAAEFVRALLHLAASLSAWRRATEMCWRIRAGGRLPSTCHAEVGQQLEASCHVDVDGASCLTMSEKAQLVSRAADERCLRCAWDRWRNSAAMACARERLNDITCRMQETLSTLASLWVAAKELKLQRRVFVAWTHCLVSNSVNDAASVDDSLTYSFASTITLAPGSSASNSGTGENTLRVHRRSWQASESLPSEPALHRAFAFGSPFELTSFVGSRACVLSESAPASLLNRAALSSTASAGLK